MAEEWKQVDGYPAYDVSNEGQVRSYWTREGVSPLGCRIGRTPRRILKPCLDGSGYKMVHLHTGTGGSRAHKVATLVIETFRGPRPDGMHVCHNNSLCCDNRLVNLRYDTPAGNSADRSAAAKRAPSRKLTDQQVIDIRVSNVVDGITQMALAEKYAVTKGAVSMVCSSLSYPDLPGPRTTDKHNPTEALKQYTARAWV